MISVLGQTAVCPFFFFFKWFLVWCGSIGAGESGFSSGLQRVPGAQRPLWSEHCGLSSNFSFLCFCPQSRPSTDEKKTNLKVKRKQIRNASVWCCVDVWNCDITQLQERRLFKIGYIMFGNELERNKGENPQHPLLLSHGAASAFIYWFIYRRNSSVEVLKRSVNSRIGSNGTSSRL